MAMQQVHSRPPNIRLQATETSCRTGLISVSGVLMHRLEVVPCGWR